MIKCYQEKFPNSTFFFADNPIKVFWGDYSILESDLICFRQLLARNKDWKILVNGAATELPLKPISRIREILRNTTGNGIIVSKENTNQGRHSFAYKSESIRF